MHVNLARLIPATAALALVLAACGSESPAGDELPDAASATTVADGELRAPTPIRVTGGGASDRVAAASAEDAPAADSSMIAMPYVTYDYVVSIDPATLPTNSTGYVFDAATEPTADDIMALAAALGVEGEPVRIDEGYGLNWRVGPDDGTAPSIWLYDDALLSWNYNIGWDDTVSRGCVEPAVDPAVTIAEPNDAESADAGSTAAEETASGDDPVDPIEPVECEAPEPPANVPTESQAVEQANAYLAALGVDVAGLQYDNYVDEWAANVNASERIDGVVTRSWGFTFGADGALQYAWGSQAVPQPVGPYTLIDLDTAIARLESGQYGFGAFGPGIAVDAPAIEPGIAVAEEPPVDVPEGDVDGTVVPPEPEVVTVELVSVEADLWWAWDEDTSSWLLPGYRFVSADGGWFTVPAVTDEFLIEVPVDEVIDPVPLPTETVPPESIPVEPPVTTVPVDTLAPLVGSTLDEFTAAAETAGYTVRVVEIDGEPQAMTMDLRLDRINVAIVTVDGLEQVVRATLDDGTLIGEVPVEPAVVEPDVAEPDLAAIEAELRASFEGVLPMTLEEFADRAKALGFETRVSVQDGEELEVTADERFDRVNVELADGQVVAIRYVG